MALINIFFGGRQPTLREQLRERHEQIAARSALRQEEDVAYRTEQSALKAWADATGRYATDTGLCVFFSDIFRHIQNESPVKHAGGHMDYGFMGAPKPTDVHHLGDIKLTRGPAKYGWGKAGKFERSQAFQIYTRPESVFGVLLTAPGLKAYGIHNDYFHFAYVRFDRGNSEGLRALGTQLGLKPKAD